VGLNYGHRQSALERLGGRRALGRLTVGELRVTH